MQYFYLIHAYVRTLQLLKHSFMQTVSDKVVTYYKNTACLSVSALIMPTVFRVLGWDQREVHFL